MTRLQDSLPSLHVGVLPHDAWPDYVADLRTIASAAAVVVRRGRQRTEESTLDAIAALPQSIADGTALGAQVAYTFEGHRYRDVLMPVAGGIRVVRMRSDELTG